ncbi:hypothetical protein Krac_9497 [Ktedonobacter racemifer DSM 44963]|uniref:Uncharacterized protein n=1 Tax=Ktedonobacter racemifer DSM 44963 TaxID=485913 RepID=D6TC69_KTERA|nr:hypothetical protein Krac_9497 [Ktedonobacter racemifer DSM 44963]
MLRTLLLLLLLLEKNVLASVSGGFVLLVVPFFLTGLGVNPNIIRLMPTLGVYCLLPELKEICSVQKIQLVMSSKYARAHDLVLSLLVDGSCANSLEGCPF